MVTPHVQQSASAYICDPDELEGSVCVRLRVAGLKSSSTCNFSSLLDFSSLMISSTRMPSDNMSLTLRMSSWSG